MSTETYIINGPGRAEEFADAKQLPEGVLVKIAVRVPNGPTVHLEASFLPDAVAALKLACDIVMNEVTEEIGALVRAATEEGAELITINLSEDISGRLAS